MSRENNHADIRAKLQYFLTTKKIPNIIFHGESLSGKRGLLNEFLHHIYQGDRVKMKSHVMTVECCHGKGIKFIREELKFFAKAHIQSNHGANFKSIVLLNADSLTIDAQSALRRCIELFSHNTRFFILVENKERLLNPILSRFCEIYVATGTDGEPAVPPDVVADYQDVTQSITRELPHTCGAPWFIMRCNGAKTDGRPMTGWRRVRRTPRKNTCRFITISPWRFTASNPILDAKRC